MNQFTIYDEKKSYGKKSISKYDKVKLLKCFKDSIIKYDYEKSMYFGFEIINSGWFKQFWQEIFLIMAEYINLHSKELPSVLYNCYDKFEKIRKISQNRGRRKIDIRNNKEIKKIITFVIKNVCFCKNKHISDYIHPGFSNQNLRNASKNDILRLAKIFKRFMGILIRNKISHKDNGFVIKEKFFRTCGALMALDCDSLYSRDYPYNINMYNHTKSQTHSLIMKIFWNYILINAKVIKPLMKQIIAIKKIMDTKLLHNIGKDTYLILHLLLLLFYDCRIEEIKIINKDDYLFVQKLYYNTQRSIKTEEVRRDYIMIEPPKKKITIKKKIKVNTNGRNKLVKRPRIVVISEPVVQQPETQLGDQDKALMIKHEKPENFTIIKKEEEVKVEKKEVEEKKLTPLPEIDFFGITNSRYTNYEEEPKKGKGSKKKREEKLFFENNKEYSFYEKCLFDFDELPQKKQKANIPYYDKDRRTKDLKFKHKKRKNTFSEVIKIRE